MRDTNPDFSSFALGGEDDSPLGGLLADLLRQWEDLDAPHPGPAQPPDGPGAWRRYPTAAPAPWEEPDARALGRLAAATAAAVAGPDVAGGGRGDSGKAAYTDREAACGDNGGARHQEEADNARASQPDAARASAGRAEELPVDVGVSPAEAAAEAGEETTDTAAAAEESLTAAEPVGTAEPADFIAESEDERVADGESAGEAREAKADEQVATEESAAADASADINSGETGPAGDRESVRAAAPAEAPEAGSHAEDVAPEASPSAETNQVPAGGPAPGCGEPEAAGTEPPAMTGRETPADESGLAAEQKAQAVIPLAAMEPDDVSDISQQAADAPAGTSIEFRDEPSRPPRQDNGYAGVLFLEEDEGGPLFEPVADMAGMPPAVEAQAWSAEPDQNPPHGGGGPGATEEDSAPDEPAAPSAHQTAAAPVLPEPALFLVFETGGSRFALPAGSVEQAAQMPTITRAPWMPAFARGLISLRGEILPLFDLASLMGIRLSSGGRGEKLIVVRTGRFAEAAAFAVDSVTGTASLEAGEAAGALRFLDERTRQVVAGIAAHGERLVTALDPERLFQYAEQRAKASGAGATPR